MLIAIYTELHHDAKAVKVLDDAIQYHKNSGKNSSSKLASVKY